jgi:hypothetical protein
MSLIEMFGLIFNIFSFVSSINAVSPISRNIHIRCIKIGTLDSGKKDKSKRGGFEWFIKGMDTPPNQTAVQKTNVLLFI